MIMDTLPTWWESEYFAYLKIQPNSKMYFRWHLGWCNETYLPNSRGFDEFRGIWHSGTDHYSYLDNSQDAYDLHSGTDADYTYNGQYSTDTYANYAQTLIEAHDANDPLFMYVASNTIHTPWEVMSNP